MTDYELFERCQAMTRRPYNEIAERYVGLAIDRLAVGDKPWLAVYATTDLLIFKHKRQSVALTTVGGDDD